MDELDRILGSEGELEPSSGLTAAVMDAVREEARSQAPLAFPWRRAVPGMTVCVLLLVVGIVLLAIRGVANGSGPSPEELVQWVRSPAGMAWGWAAFGLLISYLSWRVPMKMVGR